MFAIPEACGLYLAGILALTGPMCKSATKYVRFVTILASLALFLPRLAMGQTVTSATVPSSPLAGGPTVFCDFYLSAPAPSGGLTVYFSSSDPTLASSVWASLTVPSGQTSWSTDIQTHSVSVAAAVQITCYTTGSTGAVATVDIVPPVPGNLRVFGSPIGGGKSATGLVYLTGPAPKGGLTFTPTSNSPNATCGPCFIPQGKSDSGFTIQTKNVLERQSIQLSAGVAETSFILVPSTATMTLPNNWFGAGTTISGSIILSGNAPPGGAVVSLTSSVLGVIVPATVSIAAGGTQGTASIAIGNQVPTGSVAITVSYLGDGTTTKFSVLDYYVEKVYVAGHIPSSGTATGTVSIYNANPAVGVTIALSSDQPFVQVPPTVSIPAGETSATFQVTTSPIASGDTATITAAASGRNAFCPVFVGFSGIPPTSWGTSLSDAQNSSRSFGRNAGGAVGWQNTTLHVQSLLESDGNLYVISPTATADNSFTLTGSTRQTGPLFGPDLLLRALPPRP